MKRLRSILRNAKTAALALALSVVAVSLVGGAGQESWAQTKNPTLLSLIAAIKTAPNGQLPQNFTFQVYQYLATNQAAAATIASSLVNTSGSINGQAGVNLTNQVVGALNQAIAAMTNTRGGQAALAPAVAGAVARGIGASVAVLAANGYPGAANAAATSVTSSQYLPSVSFGIGMAAGLRSLPGTMPNGNVTSTSLTNAIGNTDLVKAAIQSSGQASNSPSLPQPTTINPNQVTQCQSQTGGSCN